jgi:hypothetical protein
MEVLELRLDVFYHVTTAPSLVSTRTFGDVALNIFAQLVEFSLDDVDHFAVLGDLSGLVDRALEVGTETVQSLTKGLENLLGFTPVG